MRNAKGTLAEEATSVGRVVLGGLTGLVCGARFPLTSRVMTT